MLIFCSLLLYTVLGYLLERQQFQLFIVLCGILFAAYLLFYTYEQTLSFRQIFALGSLFRLVFLLSIPILSDDYFRFIWDGHLLLEGYNPYLYKPLDCAFLREKGMYYDGLFASMNSPAYYSVYPPLKQGIFFLSALPGTSLLLNILTLRIIIYIADMGIFYLLRKLSVSKPMLLLFFLNPFWIIEFSGNLHFEGIMLFFVLASFYFLQQKKIPVAGIYMGLGIAVKLLPCIILPFILVRLGWKKGLLFCLISGILFLLLLLPFVSEESIRHIFSSIELYFLHFEFNAGIYYILREIGYVLYGYNIIYLLGKILPLATFILTLGLVYLYNKNKSEENFYTGILLALLIYFLLSSIVHPWYIGSLLLLGIFTPFRFPFVWSFLVMLSYHAYASVPVKENAWLLALAYLVLFGVIGYELKRLNWKVK